MPTPTEYYQDLVSQGEIQPDQAQAEIIPIFQQLYDDLISWQKKSWLKKMFHNKSSHGLYLWGGVGAGKTHMMDIFYQCLPFKNKLRTHFHRFMKDIHKRLHHHQGQKDPLKIIASELAHDYCVICFDEFFVSEITDAMILGELFEALFNENIMLVTTSNFKPDELYKNGLQRQRFLPAIELIKQNTSVVEIKSTTDYRLQAFHRAGVFFTPLNHDAEQNMEQQFKSIATGNIKQKGMINIEGREIKTIAKSSDTVWFEFDIICQPPRSQVDYIDIAHRYHTVFVSNVPQILDREFDKARYLINLVDVLYDAKVNLVMSAAVPVMDIYQKGFLFFEFQRTQSRLLEMQSEQYLSRQHTHHMKYYRVQKSET